MARQLNILANVFGCLTVVLLVLGVLTVSPYAWADVPCSSDGDCDSGYYCDGQFCQIIPLTCPNPTTNNCPGKSKGDCNDPATTCSNKTNSCGCLWYTYNGPGGPIEYCSCP